MLLGTRDRLIIAVALCAIPQSAGAGGRLVLHDATIVTDGELVRGADANVFVAVTGARTLTQSEPIAGASVEVSLVASLVAGPGPGTDESSASAAAEPNAAGARAAGSRAAGSKATPSNPAESTASESAESAATASVPAGSSASSASAPPASTPARARPLPTRVAHTRTGADGTAVLRFRVPTVPPGSYRLVVTTRSEHGASTTERAVEVSDRMHLQLRTDRGVYRPGQTILWRVTALSAADAHPAAGEEVEIAIRDPRDTAIWRGRQTVPAGGMIAGSIPLADDLLTGRYELTARVRDIVQTERVDVRSFRLPAFAIELERRGDKPLQPGDTLSASLTARYRYGEPVQGDVTVELAGPGIHDTASIRGPDEARDETRDETPDEKRNDKRDRTPGGPVRAQLDRNGVHSFTMRVPPEAEGTLDLHATVIDGAGRRERSTLSIPLGGGDDLRVALVPEREVPIRGAWHRFTALTTDGHGRLVPARVQIRANGRRTVLQSPGAARVALRAPEAAIWKLRVSAVGAGADVDEQSLELRPVPGPVLRLHEAAIPAGDPVVVTGEWRDARGPVLATLLREHAPIAAALARIDRRGVLRAVLTPPTGSFGLVTVRLVDLGWDPKRDRTPAESAEHLNAYLRPAELSVSISAETRHRPGQRAELQVAVRDAAGRPVPGAALAASAVDERVLALSEPRPDLTEALRSFDKVDDATTLGLAFADLLRATSAVAAISTLPTDRPGTTADASSIDPVAARDAAALRAILEALPAPRKLPEVILPAQVRWHRESERIGRMQEPAFSRLVAAPGAIGSRGTDGRWRYRRELWQLLAEAGWKQSDRITPWREPTTWAYAEPMDPQLGFARMAPRVADQRLDALVLALRHRFSRHRRLLLRRGSPALAELAARGAIGPNLTVDPWGTAIRVERQGGPLHPLLPEPTVDLVSAGPDLAFGTGDDLRREDVFAWVTFGNVGALGTGSGSGSGYGSVASAPSVRIGAASEEPLLRKRFDETVLWRVGIATGPAGTARLSVPLGDSITGWKVAVEALSRSGATGAAETRLETFLPLHLDAELPPRLAVGDRYRIPISVANHSGVPQRLRIASELSGALRRAAASRGLDLAAGATGVVHIDAEALRAGDGRVRLALLADGRAVDQVERTIAIEPPGELVRALHTGEVLDGAARFRFELPAAAATSRGVLRLFRGAADQAIDGLDGMLAEPHGCFEQTSSTTYPNLLVLRLLRGAPRMERVRARARDLVGQGYQRLISYEVQGGGFSWFGETPANQVLTAYGLMEFVNMAAVYPVNPALIARTRAWLLAKQQRDGSWRPDAAWLHDWSTVQSQLATTAFIAWSLAESGARGRPLERALAYLRGRRADLGRSPYLLALWAAAESAHQGTRNPALASLLRAGTSEGSGLGFRAAGKTLLHARGQAADVQVTALAATALARGGRRAEARRALDWLWKARSGSYGWGTTQSTVLALRAAALATAPAPSSGILHARIDGKPAGTIDLASIDVPSLTLPALPPGSHELILEGDAPGQLRADLRLSWRERSAAREHAAGLSVALTAPSTSIPLGGRASFAATIKNLTREPVAMPTAVLPIPPGFAADPASVARLRRTPGISRVEDQGDSLVVYLLDLAAGAAIDLRYQLDAQAECSVLQRPASAYAFYTPELRGHSSAQRLTVRRGAPTGRTATAPDHHRSPPRPVWW